MATPCPPKTCTVWVNEYVQEQVPCTRTVYTKECKTETYTAYKTVCVPEVRTRNVTTYKTVCETVNETRTYCVSVPVCRGADGDEELHRLQAGHHVTRKCEDHGHYECKEVPCGPSFSDSLKKHFQHKKDCCDPCATECCKPVKTKTVKVWVPCPVWVEKCCTVMEKSTECHAEVVKVTVCKKEMQDRSGAGHEDPLRPGMPHRDLHGQRQPLRAVPGHPAGDGVRAAHRDHMVCRTVCKKVAKEVPVVESCCNSCARPAIAVPRPATPAAGKKHSCSAIKQSPQAGCRPPSRDRPLTTRHGVRVTLGCRVAFTALAQLLSPARRLLVQSRPFNGTVGRRSRTCPDA